MKIGISTASLFCVRETEDAFADLARMGCEVAEVFFASSCEYGRAFCASVDTCGIEVHSVHALGTQFEPELFSAHHRVREDAERVLRSVLEGGAALGAKYLTFHGPMQLKKLPFTPDPARVAARMSAVMDICRVYGITPAYENVHYTYGATPAYLAGLCRLLPDLRITLDVKQARQAGVSELDFIRAVGDRIVTVHLCDVLPSNVPALPGRGVVDFSALFAALSARRISAPCLLEVYPGDYKTLDELEACFHALKRLANST